MNPRGIDYFIAAAMCTIRGRCAKDVGFLPSEDRLSRRLASNPAAIALDDVTIP
jgi:hypothetical protein